MQENKKVMIFDVDESDKPILSTGRIGYDSRSMAVVVVLTNIREDRFILEKRGPGCPDEIGKYVFPCGYLAWGEDLMDAAKREVYEEIGLVINKRRLKFVGIEDSPSSNRQNVTVQFSYHMTDKEMDSLRFDYNSFSRGGEKDEVSEVILATRSWILQNKDKIGFGHEELI